VRRGIPYRYSPKYSKAPSTLIATRSFNVYKDLSRTSQPHVARIEGNTSKAREKPNNFAKTREVVVALSTISKKFCG
jgi:hypothetical protein